MDLPKLKIAWGASAPSPEQQHADWEYACFQLILKEIRSMSVQLDALKAQVAANTKLEASAVTLIQGIAAQIAANAGDQAAMTQLAADLKASADALGAAVAANTPAAPPATP